MGRETAGTREEKLRGKDAPQANPGRGMDALRPGAGTGMEAGARGGEAAAVAAWPSTPENTESGMEAAQPLAGEPLTFQKPVDADAGSCE